MKTILVCLLLSSSSVTFADGKVGRFTFPPFAQEDIALPAQPLPDHPSYDELKAIPVEQLRGIMASTDSPDQSIAAKELVARGDQITILRLVYSLKQGNVQAEDILDVGALTPIPYLMEDVAHGSLDYYGSYSFGDGVLVDGRMRQLIVTHVASILFRATEFTGETRECLRAIGRGNPDQVQGLSDESRYLVQWWLLNKDVFEAGKWDETRPLPQEITYPDPKRDKSLPPDEQWDPKKQPPFGSPLWELPESFEEWSKRIVHPELRNLNFVELTWDGKKVIEHPAKSLDPKARPDRESRKDSFSRSKATEGIAEKIKGIPWLAWCAALAIVAGLITLLVKRKT
ncbi:MAG: hypothetical protein ABIS50_15750 [Luteolibacter sp.]|uniref:hypothetical protein n=1 Tax=Luteolibacter sp. TaxID=1962973 RepID=UPI003264CC0A